MFLSHERQPEVECFPFDLFWCHHLHNGASHQKQKNKSFSSLWWGAKTSQQKFCFIYINNYEDKANSVLLFTVRQRYSANLQLTKTFRVT